MKFVLIDNGDVVARVDDFIEAVRYQRAHPECFLTLVGDEDFGSRVYQDRRTGNHHTDSHNNASASNQQQDIYIVSADIPRALYDDPVPHEHFSGSCKFYGLSKRPYIKLGIILDTAQVLPTWFLLDTGSPFTFIEDSTVRKIYGGQAPLTQSFPIEFCGFTRFPTNIVRLSHAHFSQVNILGTDILWEGKLEIEHSLRHISYKQ